MRYLVFSFSLLGFWGCCCYQSTKEDLHEITQENLSHMYIGMTEKQALQIMGSPEKIETYHLESGPYIGTHQVWLYSLGEEKTGSFSEDYLPLIFQNGTVQGWDYDYYNHLVSGEKSESQPIKKASPYTDSPTKWPAKEHRWVYPPPPPEKIEEEPIEVEPPKEIEPKKEQPKEPTLSPCCPKEKPKRIFPWW